MKQDDRKTKIGDTTNSDTHPTDNTQSEARQKTTAGKSATTQNKEKIQSTVIVIQLNEKNIEQDNKK